MVGMSIGYGLNVQFVDRKEELAALERAYHARSSLAIIYGRRRLGKTLLALEFIKGKYNAYYLFTKEPVADQVRKLARTIGKAIGSRRLEEFGATDFEDLFSEVAEVQSNASKKLVIVLDEFPNVARIGNAMPSVFQKIWDSYLNGSNIMLILTGSSVGMMRSEVLNYSAPLYGRSNAIIMLGQLDFADAILLMPKGLEFEEKLELYFMLGGIPAYYSIINDMLLGSKSTRHTLSEIIRAMLGRGSIFLEEPSILLSEEVSKEERYLSILSLLAEGINKPSEIASKLGIAQGNLQQYLNLLEELGITWKEFPVTEEKKKRSKKGIYRIKDSFSLFYFYALRKVAGELQTGQLDSAIESLERMLNTFYAWKFESFVHEFLIEISKRGKTGFVIEKVGRWWGTTNAKEKGANPIEIDVVALNENTREILFGEAEWKNRKMDIRDYAQLKDKAKAVEWHSGIRKEHYALFSRSGFTEDLKRLAEREGVQLFDLIAIEKALR